MRPFVHTPAVAILAACTMLMAPVLATAAPRTGNNLPARYSAPSGAARTCSAGTLYFADRCRVEGQLVSWFTSNDPDVELVSFHGDTRPGQGGSLYVAEVVWPLGGLRITQYDGTREHVAANTQGWRIVAVEEFTAHIEPGGSIVNQWSRSEPEPSHLGSGALEEVEWTLKQLLDDGSQYWCDSNFDGHCGLYAPARYLGTPDYCTGGAETSFSEWKSYCAYNSGRAMLLTGVLGTAAALIVVGTGGITAPLVAALVAGSVGSFGIHQTVACDAWAEEAKEAIAEGCKDAQPQGAMPLVRTDYYPAPGYSMAPGSGGCPSGLPPVYAEITVCVQNTTTSDRSGHIGTSQRCRSAYAWVCAD